MSTEEERITAYQDVIIKDGKELARLQTRVDELLSENARLTDERDALLKQLAGELREKMGMNNNHAMNRDPQPENRDPQPQHGNPEEKKPVFIRTCSKCERTFETLDRKRHRCPICELNLRSL